MIFEQNIFAVFSAYPIEFFEQRSVYIMFLYGGYSALYVIYIIHKIARSFSQETAYGADLELTKTGLCCICNKQV